MLDDDGQRAASVGITTGKADVFDTGQDSLTHVPVNPGGIPIYRGGKVIGGVGVAGVRPDFAEYAATAAAAGAGRGLDFAEPLGAPGAVFIDGLRLPFFGTAPTSPASARRSAGGRRARRRDSCRTACSSSSRATACRRRRTTSSVRAAAPSPAA